ncbi:protein-disulfide reductase DsbD domain-containing protein [Dethiosulfatarculus sandiegensis]|uniref:Thiol:disulfide interchange protein DsbD N-terminal domain-containing protein n=1 Tax=Dethiosulfatarculus sandiegensis TaxID=1429043 RepID=A0A0D2JI66_9BACT|nr:protein-disulfide reductase DsbD domain-containing protein [Dethiosulfatarculus sandiegensis]KIX15396.1 hypothetical protein X474_03500 [Dethiosulfatarculus sandiegensis]
MKAWIDRKIIGLITALCLVFIFQAGFALAGEELVDIKVLQSRKAYQPGKAYPLALALNIKRGVHINSLKPKDPDLVPTALKFSQVKGINLALPVFPEPVSHKPDFMEKPVLSYSGRVLVMTEVEFDPDLKPGEYLVRGNLFFQGCDDQMCFMPQARDFEVRLSVASLGEKSPLLHPEVFAK